MINRIISIISKFFKRKKTENIESEIVKLENKLLKLFKQKDAFVISISGEWGVGKTHFFDSFVKTHLKTETVAYVSLFGKESIKDILNSIMIQISKHFERAEEANEVFGSTKIVGIDLAAVFSLGKPRDFKNVIVCIDDFERSSDKLEDKDILGLISELKERKNCKVVMIYNQDEIESDILSNYKDKVLDYELHYKPTALESFTHIKNKLKIFHEETLEYFEDKGITNIRVMRRAINALNDFEFIKIHLTNHSYIKYEILNTLLKFSVVNAQYQNFNFEELVEYISEKRLAQDGHFEINNEKENIFYFFDTEDSNWLMQDALTENIDNYIKSSIPDENALINIVNKRKQQVNRSNVMNLAKKIHSRFNYDLNYENDEYAKDMSLLLFDNKDSIVEILNVESFIYYISELSIIDSTNKGEYHTFGLKSVQDYLTYYLESNTLDDLDHFGTLSAIIDFDNSLDDFIKEIINSQDKKKVASKERILELMKSPIKNRGWGNEPELLKSVEVDTYKTYILEDAEFLKDIMMFIRWTKGFGNGSGFEEAVDKQVEALRDLALNGNNNTQFKMQKILKHLNISIEEEVSEEQIEVNINE